MLPLKDNIPYRHTPYAVYTIIGINALVFLFQMGMSQEQMIRLFHVLGVVPARYFHAEWAAWMGYPETFVLPFFTHMFLHSGFFHFLFNMWVMWIFADNVEDVMGPFRFVLFFLLCGLGALATHMFFNMDSKIPVVGASGAIAGVMGAYFILYPHARVVTLIPIFIFPYIIELPAVIFLGIWFLSQVSTGLFASGAAQGGGGVAWWAHAGGFVAGILLLPLFRSNERCYYCYDRSRDEDKTFSFR